MGMCCGRVGGGGVRVLVFWDRVKACNRGAGGRRRRDVSEEGKGAG